MSFIYTDRSSQAECISLILKKYYNKKSKGILKKKGEDNGKEVMGT